MSTFRVLYNLQVIPFCYLILIGVAFPDLSRTLQFSLSLLTLPHKSVAARFLLH